MLTRRAATLGRSLILGVGRFISAGSWPGLWDQRVALAEGEPHRGTAAIWSGIQRVLRVDLMSGSGPMAVEPLPFRQYVLSPIRVADPSSQYLAREWHRSTPAAPPCAVLSWPLWVATTRPAGQMSEAAGRRIGCSSSREGTDSWRSLSRPSAREPVNELGPSHGLEPTDRSPVQRGRGPLARRRPATVVGSCGTAAGVSGIPVRAHLAAWCIFVAEAIYLTTPAIVHMSSRVIGDGRDSMQSLWNIVWIRGWLYGHHGLYFTHQLLAPGGANLGWMTLALPTNMLAALLSNLVGLVAAYNTMVLLCQLLNGASMYYLARRTGVGWLGSVAAGASFMGSGHMVAEMLGHINLLQAFFVIWFITVLWGVLNAPSVRWIQYLLLGAVWAATFYAIEDYALYELAAAVALGFTHPGIHGSHLRALLSKWWGWLMAGLLGLATTAPLWSVLAWGPLSVGLGAVAQPTSTPYVVDLFGLVIPGPWGLFWWLGPRWHLSAGLVEVAFPGFLVLAALYAIWRTRWPEPARQRGVARAAVIGVVVFGVLELGPYLHVDGLATSIPLPYLVLSHLPGWSVTLPVRLSVLTAIFGSMLVGAMTDRLMSLEAVQRGQTLHKGALILGGIALLVLGGSWLPFPLAPVPKVVDAGAIRKAGGEVLFVPAVIPFTAPMPGPTNYMYWDAVLGAPTPEGYVSRLPQSTIVRVSDTAVLRFFWEWQLPVDYSQNLYAEAARGLTSYLHANDIRTIVVLTTEVSAPSTRIAWLRQHLGRHYELVNRPNAAIFIWQPRAN